MRISIVWSGGSPYSQKIPALLTAVNRLETTALYAQVATDLLHEVTSPLERLPARFPGALQAGLGRTFASGPPRQMPWWLDGRLEPGGRPRSARRRGNPTGMCRLELTPRLTQ
ncbi:hypothetical protein OKW49_001869 [Paraburkholderia youngii]|nr:hypothetical protein [Paraburkholderia youngii]